MTTLSADLTKGVLSGSGTQNAIIAAGTAVLQEVHAVQFRNYGGGTVTLELFVNGTTASDQIFEAPLTDKESAVLHITLTPGDTLYAEASASSSIAWFDYEGAFS